MIQAFHRRLTLSLGIALFLAAGAEAQPLRHADPAFAADPGNPYQMRRQKFREARMAAQPPLPPPPQTEASLPAEPLKVTIPDIKALARARHPAQPTSLARAPAAPSSRGGIPDSLLEIVSQWLPAEAPAPAQEMKPLLAESTAPVIAAAAPEQSPPPEPVATALVEPDAAPAVTEAAAPEIAAPAAESRIADLIEPDAAAPPAPAPVRQASGLVEPDEDAGRAKIASGPVIESPGAIIHRTTYTMQDARRIDLASDDEPSPEALAGLRPAAGPTDTGQPLIPFPQPDKPGAETPPPVAPGAVAPQPPVAVPPPVASPPPPAAESLAAPAAAPPVVETPVPAAPVVLPIAAPAEKLPSIPKPSLPATEAPPPPAAPPPAPEAVEKKTPPAPTPAKSQAEILNRLGGASVPIVQEPIAIDHARASPPALKSPDQPTAQHEAMGIKIEVKQPQLSIPEELQKAYEAVNAGNSEGAMASYRTVLNADPDNATALFGLATLYQRARMNDQAKPLYARLLTVDPSNRDGVNNYLALLSDGPPEEALAQLQRLEARQPGLSAVPAQMAMLYQRMGDSEKAAETMKRAALLAPDDLTYRYNLAILLDKQKHFQEASAYYAQIVEAYMGGASIPGDIQKIQQRLTFIRSNTP